MNKKIVYIIVALLVLAAGATVWWTFFRVAPALVPATPDTTAKTVEASQAARDSVSDSVGNANPFSADVNPVGGYVNPFE